MLPRSEMKGRTGFERSKIFKYTSEGHDDVHDANDIEEFFGIHSEKTLT